MKERRTNKNECQQVYRHVGGKGVSLHDVRAHRYSSPITGPEGSRNLRFPDFMKTAQDGG